MPSFRSRKLPYSPEVPITQVKRHVSAAKGSFCPLNFVSYLGSLPKSNDDRFRLLCDIGAAVTRRMEQADHAKKGRQLNHFLRHGFGTTYTVQLDQYQSRGGCPGRYVESQTEVSTYA